MSPKTKQEIEARIAQLRKEVEEYDYVILKEVDYNRLASIEINTTRSSEDH